LVVETDDDDGVDDGVVVEEEEPDEGVQEAGVGGGGFGAEVVNDPEVLSLFSLDEERLGNANIDVKKLMLVVLVLDPGALERDLAFLDLDLDATRILELWAVVVEVGAPYPGKRKAARDTDRAARVAGDGGGRIGRGAGDMGAGE